MDQARAGMMGKGGSVVIPPPEPRSVAARLVDDVLKGLRVFNTLDGLDIPDRLLEARARNIVAGLLGNYRIDNHPNARRSR
jgi:hypothetical protein